MPLNITKPTVGSSNNSWGTELNTALDAIKSFVDGLETSITTLQGQRGELVGVNAQTGTTYTPVLTDEGKLVTLSNAGAITITLPQDSSLAFPIGGVITFFVLGAGLPTFVAGSGATVNATPSAAARAQFSMVSVVKRAANIWVVTGDLA